MSFDPKVVRKAVRHLRASDPVMRDLIDEVGAFEMRRNRRYFHSLARAIVGQQVSVQSAAAVWNRLQQAVRPQRLTAAALLSLSTDELRGCGLSRQKIAYLTDLAGHVERGELRLNRLSRHSDERVIEKLIEVKGIGLWTAQMFLMFSLGRLDVFPHGDLGIRVAIRNLYGLDDLPDLKTPTSIAEPWSPYATVASWYLWRSIEDEDSW